MNRNERRRVIRSCMKRADLDGKSLMEALRDARPSAVYKTKPKDISPDGIGYAISESEITDYSWISAVVDEGFDPNGPLGPTYYRRVTKGTKLHHYATFIGPDGAFRLLTTEPGSPLIQQAFKRLVN